MHPFLDRTLVYHRYFPTMLVRIQDSGGNHKESPIKEVVWACGEKRGALRRKEGDGNESTGEKEERKT